MTCELCAWSASHDLVRPPASWLDARHRQGQSVGHTRSDNCRFSSDGAGLRPGWLYEIYSRNLAYGVYRPQVAGFVGLREKFDSFFLFTEYRHDTGGHFGTVGQWSELEPCPLTELAEDLGTVCVNCHAAAVFVRFSQDFPPRPDDPHPGSGRWRCECSRADPYDSVTRPMAVANQELFDWLVDRQSRYDPTWGQWYSATRTLNADPEDLPDDPDPEPGP